MAKSKKLSDRQAEAFLKENRHGVLSFQGDTPYAVPMGYSYKRKTVLLGMYPTGRKSRYLEKNRAVCFTITKPRWETPGLTVPCTSVIIEGTLEEITARSYYGLKGAPPEGLKMYKIRTVSQGTWRCCRRPCEMEAQKATRKTR